MILIRVMEVVVVVAVRVMVVLGCSGVGCGNDGCTLRQGQDGGCVALWDGKK